MQALQGKTKLRGNAQTWGLTCLNSMWYLLWILWREGIQVSWRLMLRILMCIFNFYF